ncbi:MAG: ribosome small subunit-dependent GTPase A [Bacilli bacterium]|nr:ribosome small subunit-dependent GTPase A [Bacilli bacterium]
MKGLIVALSCGVYSVSSEGVIYNVTARGIFRNQGVKPMVGDEVEFNPETMVMDVIYPRTSALKRPPIANISQIILVFSLKEPEFSYLLAFKYLTYANMNNIKAKLVLTKIDKDVDKALVEEIKEVFSSVGVETYFVSNKTKEGLEEVKQLFNNEISCVMGQTGVGKSSLINAIDANYEREIGEYSVALGRGKHRTKEVILLPYSGGYIADTPGFSSLDLNLFKEDLADFFPAFNNLYNKCYYSNCLHVSENKCAVKEKIDEGKISKKAYECYLKLLDEAIFKKERYNK